MKLKQTTKKEVAKWLMDISKYIITAAVITSFLGEFSQKWMYYSVSLLAVCICFFVGVGLFDKTK